MAHIVATCPFLAGERFSFLVRAFSIFSHFSRQTFLTLCLSFFISLLSFCVCFLWFLAFLFNFSLLSLQYLSVLDFFEIIVAAAHFVPSFPPYFQVCLLFPFWFNYILYSSFPFWVVYFSLMVDHFEIRCISPSIAFLFARLGGLLDSSIDPLGVPSHRSSDQYP